MHKRFLYLRLALTNLIKNRQTYLSFYFSAVCTTFVFYIFLGIALNGGLLKVLPGSDALRGMMALGAVVVGLFALGFLFYANSFLIKRRTKELGLYAILGLEKKHIARILLYEAAALLLATLLAGIGLGISLSRLMFLVVLRFTRVSTLPESAVGILPLRLTCLVFAGIFLCLAVYNLLRVQLSSPVKLLSGQQAGEREPKTRWLLALLGTAAMAGGYLLANSVDNPLKALLVFFAAVMLVIVGTYSLFTAGSIAVLKLLRKNRGYYYRPRNFISVSGMLYRMKQNAAGLAGICILSTMAIITIGTTLSLYIGQDAILHDQYPTDHAVSFAQGAMDTGFVEQMIRDTARQDHVEVSGLYTGAYAAGAVYREGDTLLKPEQEDLYSAQRYENVWTLFVFPLEEYNRMAGSSQVLGQDEALLFSTRDGGEAQTITAGSLILRIKENLASFPISHKGMHILQTPMYLVVRDRDAAAALFRQVDPDDEASFLQGFWWNTDGSEEALLAYAQNVRTHLRAQGVAVSSSSVDLTRREWYALYGGFLFLGVFLGLLFLMATTLIIYFKQVSEGYMDHDRFIILQKVGMSRGEVKATVRKQILMVFILPIIAAALHTWGALHMMAQMLFLFGLGDKGLITACIFGTAFVFALLYAAVYALTARTYYQMVRMDG